MYPDRFWPEFSIFMQIVFFLNKKLLSSKEFLELSTHPVNFADEESYTNELFLLRNLNMWGGNWPDVDNSPSAMFKIRKLRKFTVRFQFHSCLNHFHHFVSFSLRSNLCWHSSVRIVIAMQILHIVTGSSSAKEGRENISRNFANTVEPVFYDHLLVPVILEVNDRWW